MTLQSPYLIEISGAKMLLTMESNKILIGLNKQKRGIRWMLSVGSARKQLREWKVKMMSKRRNG